MATYLASIVPIVLFASLSWTIALAQETTNENDLRAVIEDLRGGSPDFDDMEPPLRIAIRENRANINQFLMALGPIQSIRFEETDTRVDIYYVRFRNGRTVWQFARSPRGRIAILYFNAF